MIKVIIGLGNPGNQYYYTRHSIGFRVVDLLAEKAGASWRTKGDMETSTIRMEDQDVLLVKPLTFMNASGKVISQCCRSLKADDLLVIHDELEMPFGKVASKVGGSARGHNGLKSIIAVIGPDFHRIRCGIGRPERKEEVSDYVLEPFNEDKQAVNDLIERAAACAHEVCRKLKA